MAFSPDGRWLVTVFSKSARLWQMQLDDLLNLARVTAGRNLTPQEWKQFFHGEPYHKTFPDLPAPD